MTLILSMKNLWKPKLSRYQRLMCALLLRGQAKVMWSKCVMGHSERPAVWKSEPTWWKPGRKSPRYWERSMSVWLTLPTGERMMEKVTRPQSSWTSVGDWRNSHEPRSRSAAHALCNVLHLEAHVTHGVHRIMRPGYVQTARILVLTWLVFIQRLRPLVDDKNGRSSAERELLRLVLSVWPRTH